MEDSNPSGMPVSILYSIIGLFCALILWSLFGKLDIDASAKGKLIPRTYIKVVQPVDAGVVKEILVREGQKVRRGQVLVRMDANLINADTAAINDELEVSDLELRRIESELTGKSMKLGQEDTDVLFSQVRGQLLDHEREYSESMMQARESYEKAQHDYDSSRKVLDKLKVITPILKQQADAYEDMAKHGYVPLIMARDKRREFIEKEQDLEAQEYTVKGLANSIRLAKEQVDLISSKYRSNLENERISTEKSNKKLRQEQVKQIHKSKFMELKAPQDGIVKELAIHSIGTVLSPGAVILTIVPDNEPLVVEAMINNDDVGFVRPEQHVRLKVNSFPFEEYGMIDGEVERVEADSQDNTASQYGVRGSGDSSQSSYKAIISLNNQFIESGGRKLNLVSGMQVVAEIKLGKRTIMQYLLSPVRKTILDSGHEL